MTAPSQHRQTTLMLAACPGSNRGTNRCKRRLARGTKNASTAATAGVAGADNVAYSTDVMLTPE
jgi:hypothetical protein